MVATRRGVRVDSSNETNQQKSSAQATPSAGRRTRTAAKQAEGVQQIFEKTCGQLSLTPVTSTKRRCTRNSRLHSPPLPSTPVGSVHEADVSEGESVCSAVSTTEPPVTRSRGENRRLRVGNRGNEEISEVESCSSVASTSKSGLRSSRSTRRKTAQQSSDSAQAEVGDVKPDLGSEAESCSSAMAKSQRVTRSQKKTPFTRSSAKLQTVDSEVSDTDSCTSSILGRASRRQKRPIPINLDELSESSQSPQTGRQTRSTRRKAAATVDVTETPTCDSEEFESGPDYSLSRNDKMQPVGFKTEDSEFDVMEASSSVGSPSFTQSRETPISSRANSGTSSQGCPAPRRSARKHGGVTENTAESVDSRLESTVIADDEDHTLLEEDQIQTSEDVNDTDLCASEADTKTENKDVTNTSDEDSHAALSASVCVEKADEESAMITKDQEEALSPKEKDEDISDVEMMQETVTPSERVQPSQTVTVTIPEKASETTEEVDEKQEAAVQLTEEEEEVSRLKTASQKVIKDSVVQSTKIISLLDSSDDDDDDFGEEGESEEEEEKRGGPSNMSAASVKGLFMIDTRPGQDADELYCREEEEVINLRLDQDEEDEEFVDEEGDDDDDEDTQILLSSRSSHLKEMSSRIDPGIRMKELGGLYISFDGSKSKPVSSSLQKLKEKKNLDEVMKKSVIGPDFEKKDAVPPYSESKQALKLKHRAEREKSTGNGWFNMKAPELTPELKGDLKVLKMRGSLDPKRFYKKNDRDGFPKYFQIGTVVDNPADFYHSQIPKKARKRTMVEELLADAEFRHKNKKRYQQIMAEKAAQGADRRRRKKFHKKKI